MLTLDQALFVLQPLLLLYVAAFTKNGNSFTGDSFVTRIGRQIQSERQIDCFRLMINHLHSVFLLNDAIHFRSLVIHHSASQVIEVD